MKIAVVGTSLNLTDNEERDIRQLIALSLKNYTSNDVIISGGAKGVDSIAIEIAQGLGLKTEVYKPKNQNWSAFKARNLKIAKDCDELCCISVPVHKQKCYHHDGGLADHEKTAGCWTMRKALEMGKFCQLMVTPKR